MTSRLDFPTKRANLAKGPRKVITPTEEDKMVWQTFYRR